jgi:hypothetical protein
MNSVTNSHGSTHNTKICAGYERRHYAMSAAPNGGYLRASSAHHVTG